MKVCVISYGSIVTKEKDNYTNPAITEVLNHLAKKYQVIYLAAKADEKSCLITKEGYPVYSSKISEGVLVCPLLSTENSETLFGKLWISIKNIKKIYKMIKKSDIVFIYLPSYTNLIAGIISILLHKHTGIYIGSDWKTLINLKKYGRLTKQCYSTGYRIISEKIFDQASFILVAGRKLFLELQKKGRNVIETIPSVRFKINELTKDYVRVHKFNKYEYINLLLVGPINERKGVIYLIKAVPFLLKKGIIPYLHLVGAVDNDYKIILEKEINLHRISHLVTFYGYVSKKEILMKIFRKADIFVLPSLAEGFPRVIYEALAAELPVIVSGLPSIRESISNDIVFFVPPKDPEAIANAVIEIIKNSEKRTEMIKKGKEYVKSKFVKKTHFEQIEELIEKCFKEKNEED